MGPVTSALGEMYAFEARGKPACPQGAPEDAEDGCWSLMELREILDWDIAHEVRSVPGVVELNVFGEQRFLGRDELAKNVHLVGLRRCDEI